MANTSESSILSMTIPSAPMLIHKKVNSPNAEVLIKGTIFILLVFHLKFLFDFEILITKILFNLNG